MGKRRKNKRNKNRTQPRPAQAPAQSGGVSTKRASEKEETPAIQIERISKAAKQHGTNSDLTALKGRPGPAPGTSLEELVAKGNEALALLEVQLERTRKEEQGAKAKAVEIDEARKSVESEREQVQLLLAESEEEATRIATKKKALDAREHALLQREEELVQRESDADAGFSQRNRLSLESLKREAKEYREEFSTHRATIASERGAWEKELLEKRSDLQEELEQRRSELDAEMNELIGERKVEVEKRETTCAAKDVEQRTEDARLRKEARDLEVDKELLDEDREAANERAERLAAAKLEQKDAEIAAHKERLMMARQGRDELARQIGDREEADRRFGDRTPDEVLAELRELRREREELRQKLGGRPSAEAFQRLEELERQREGWEGERLSLVGDVAELRQQLVRRNIAVTELEALRDHKAALEASNELLSKALEDEIRRVNDLVRGADSVSPFPSCSRMDNDSDLQASRPTMDTIRSLEDFAEYVRHRIAYDETTEKNLFYSGADVRSFIGGLAMSRLHILQGISGTGKTSLPLAFARAIGAGQALIEVQAGWRDRQDLIGHFNTFERRFYESEFLQALYQAKCPQYRDTPFIVVLDEMNLSHPEQYFADLLSALEQEQHRQRLVLMTAAVEPAPALMDGGGRVLQVPENVWFVGTANHDETTKDFADKTYDRAHVMELPRHREVFDINDAKPTSPVGLNALQRAFDQAIQAHAAQSEAAYEFLDGHLGGILGRRFGVGWGNRLQRQMENYVPVVIDCGGSVGEATDYVLATKLLRKIRDRHDNRADDVIELRDCIRDEWPALDEETQPNKCLDILVEELRRLRHDED